MKEKILLKLKTAVGENAVTTDITLNKWADYLTAKITDETQIDAEIETLKPILSTYDGNLNFVVAREVKKAKETTPPPAPPTPPADPSEPSWFTQYKESQIAKATELETKLTAFQKEKANEVMVAEAKNAFYKKYRISESEKALAEKALNIELRLNTHEKADNIVEGWKTQYEDLRNASGLGGVEPIESNGGNKGGNKGTPQLNALKDSLRREGKLPTPAQTT